MVKAVRFFLLLSFVAGVVLAPLGPAAAQEGQREPSQEEVQMMMQNTMIPMMGEMMNVMMDSMARTLAKPQIAENFASFTRNYYDALRTRGFTDEEALRIVTAAGIPSAGGPQQ